MELLGNPKLRYWLKRLNSEGAKKFDTFIWNDGHMSAVLRYVQRQYSNDVWSMNLLQRLEASRGTPQFPRTVLSFVDKLRDFFRPPTVVSLSSNYKTNEILITFLDFLLDTAQEVVKHHAKLIDRVDDEMDTLQKELTFVITVLGDTPFSCTEVEVTKKIIQETECVAEEAGRFLYEYFFSKEGELSRHDLSYSVSGLLRKFENLEKKIREHCVAVYKLPCFTVPNIAVESTFMVDSLLNDLKDLLNRDENLVSDVSDKMKALQEELMALKSFLGFLKMNDELVMLIRDVAYEAEYVINSYIIGDVPIWYLNIRLPLVIHKAKLISIGLEGIQKDHDNHNCLIESFMVGDVPVCYSKGSRPDFKDTKINTSQKYSTNSSQEAAKMSTDDIFVGFEAEEELIAHQLTEGPKKLQVITIIGMPGLGKTTLAKKLYNSPVVFERFHRCAWVVVSETYQERRLLVDILKAVTDLNHNEILTKDSESLMKMLHQSLFGRRVLIVMDDVWNSSAVDMMVRLLQNNIGDWSRLLVTTRNKEAVPSHSTIHTIPVLSDEQCWDLLQLKVFGKQDCPQDLVETGKQIAQKCQRLPLAVVIIAAVLANMNNEKSSWIEVSRSLTSHIADDHENKCMGIMELSYKHLPLHLKPCFLYFAAFSKNSKISVLRLMSLWIAEGFIQQKDGRSLREVAEEYLTNLIDRSLVVVLDTHSGGGVKACRIHDLLRELCIRIANKENFLNLIKDRFSVYEKHHRLCIPSESGYAESRPVGPHIRSWIGHWSEISSVYSTLKRLRIFDVSVPEHPEDVTGTNDVDLTGIEQLVHLRYLAVSLTRKTIPPSVGCLWNLEFLLLDGLEEFEIPETILDLAKLRHLQVRKHGTFDESCHRRATVGNDLHMNSLESISNFQIVREDDEKILRRAPHIRRLKCTTKPLWDTSEKCYRQLTLNYLTCLESLSMSYLDSDRKFYDTLDLPTTLTKLTLKMVKLSWTEMSMIGKLPKLETLKLSDPILDGKEWKANDKEFKQLKFLKLEALKIRRWNWEETAEPFPELRHLALLRCWKLKELPSSLGYISMLEIINVRSCNKSVENSARKIKEEQLAMGNEELKVIVSGTL